MEKVSIIVPIYNMGNNLEKSIGALLKQSYENIEVLLIDDGSTDNSLEECVKLEKSDTRVKVFHTENRGSGLARNYGIKNATGEYLYFPDADDYIEPAAIKTMVEYARNTVADIVICGYTYRNRKTGRTLFTKKYVHTKISGEELRDNYAFYKMGSPNHGFGGAPWNKLFKKSVVDKNCLEYPPLRRHQDEAFIAKFFGCCERIVFIEEVLYTYYVNDIEAQWQKFPMNYIDIACDLFAERKSNVLKWNPADADTKNMVYREFINNTVKAMELSFFPKFGFNGKQRKMWLKEKSSESEIMNLSVPENLGKYQNLIVRLIKKQRIGMLYCVLKLKTTIYDCCLKR